jgi:hypothetical protein
VSGNALMVVTMPIDFVLFLFSFVSCVLSITIALAMPIKLPQRLTNQQALLRCIGRPVSRATGRKMTAV